ncbi:MAG TPA: iron-containing alcohol dehydrogenase, partial [Burkholderiales bacterium]|nr:iron-containing alcohol dehydrogenase [Burkholderiales bacterium]
MSSTGFLYRNPTHRLVFGRGALDRIAEELVASGLRKPMLVCSTRGAASDAARKIMQSLPIEHGAVFSGVRPHAPLASVNAAWEQARGL